MAHLPASPGLHYAKNGALRCPHPLSGASPQHRHHWPTLLPSPGTAGLCAVQRTNPNSTRAPLRCPPSSTIPSSDCASVINSPQQHSSAPPSLSSLDGRKLRLRLASLRHSRAALQVLRRVAQRAPLTSTRFSLSLSHQEEGGQGSSSSAASTSHAWGEEGSGGPVLRFPAAEFRSLVLNPLGKDRFPDKALWKRLKVDLCRLLLLKAAGQADAFQRDMQRIVDTAATSLPGTRMPLGAAATTAGAAAAGRGSGGSVVGRAERQARQAASHEVRRLRLHSQIEGWCAATLASEDFAVLAPFLERVLQGGDPAPLVDIRRDGSRTELAVASLLAGQLPEGWSLLAGATLVAVDGRPFHSRKMLKGEADVLLVCPGGVVQAVLEVKTAKGNPYLALYDDVDKLTGMLDQVRGRTVTVRCGANASERIITLPFSQRLRPIYVLGCGGSGGSFPDARSSGADASSIASGSGMRAALRAARSKLLTMQLGRVLSSRAASWAGVSIKALSREVVLLQLLGGSELYASLERQVSGYFATLEQCEIYIVST